MIPVKDVQIPPFNKCLSVDPDMIDVNRCGGAGDHTRAVEIFDEARYVHRVPPSLQIYGALLSALAKAEQWVDVLAYLDRMVADGIAPDAAATNAGVLAAAELGNGLRALSLLNGDRLQPRKWARDRRRTRDADKGSEDRHEGREERLRTGAAPWDEGQANGQREGASDGEGGHHARRSTSPKGGEIGISGKTEDREEGGEVEGGVMREGPEGTARLYKARAGGRGGWKAAKPALLISVLHALDSEGENVSVLEAVRRGREEGMLLNASIYRCEGSSDWRGVQACNCAGSVEIWCWKRIVASGVSVNDSNFCRVQYSCRMKVRNIC